MTKKNRRVIESLAKACCPAEPADTSREQIKAGHSPRLGFLHIPKTGGSGIRASGARWSRRDSRSPAAFRTAGRSPRSASASRRCGSPSSCATRSSGRSAASTRGCAKAGRPTTAAGQPAEAVAFAHFPESSATSTRCSPTTTEPLGLRLRAPARRPPALELPLLLQEPGGGRRARRPPGADRPDRADRRLHRGAARRGRHPARARRRPLPAAARGAGPAREGARRLQRGRYRPVARAVRRRVRDLRGADRPRPRAARPAPAA